MRIDETLLDDATDRRPRLLPWLTVLFVGAAALGLYFVIAPALSPGAYYRSVLNRLSYGYNRQILLLFIPYGLALWAWWRGARASSKVLLGGAIALHLLVLFAPLPQSQDFYQYLFYGRMQAEFGANPYAVHPSSGFLWQDSWYGMIRWPNQTSVYGPVWTMISFGVAKAAGDSLTLGIVFMKLVIFAMDLAVMACLMILAKDRPDPEGAAGWGLLVYAWNPLIWITVPLAGLADTAIAAALIGAVLARRRGRTWITTLLLTLATLVKVYAGIALLLHLVLLLRERDRRTAWRHALVSLGVAALSFLPYWAGWQTFRGLLNAVNLSNKSLTGVVQKVIRHLLFWSGANGAADDAAAVVRWLVFPLLAATVIWAVRKVEDEHDLWYCTLFVLSMFVLLTPWFLYWYLVAPLALAAVLPRNRLTVPLLAFSGTALVTVSFAPWLASNVVQTTLRYTPPLAVYRWLPLPERPPRIQRPPRTQFHRASAEAARATILF
jgi:hypothetical protein